MPLSWAVSMPVDWQSFWMLCALAAAFLPIVSYARRRRMDAMAAGLECFLLGILLTIPVLVFSYSGMRLNYPLADARLAGADAALGVDVRWILGTVGGHHPLSVVLWWAYNSFLPQLLFLPCLLALSGFVERSYRLLTCFLVACAISSTVATVFPAIGSYQYFGLALDDMGYIQPIFGRQFLDSFVAVRSDPSFALSIRNASGILTFPSVHAAMAVLCGWAALASRRLAVPIVALNGLMFASAVTHGAHYVVDVLAGTVVAVASIGVVNRLSGSARSGGSVRPAGPAAAASAH